MDSISSVSQMNSQVKFLLDQGLIQSAEILSGLILSSCINHETLETYADTLYSKGEYKRALLYYSRAFQHHKLHGQSVKSHRNSRNVETEEEATLKFKESQCQIQLKDSNTALRDLESIPVKFRDTRINCLLGQLYKNNGLRRHAISSYKEALTQTPFAIEVIESLLSLGIAANEVFTIIEDSYSKNPTTVGISYDWLQVVITTLASRYKQSDYKETQEAFNTALQVFPNNLYLMRHFAHSAISHDEPDDAIATFRQINNLDDKVVDDMDFYGHLFYTKEDLTSLNKLANDLLGIDQRHPASWVVAAMYSELKGDQEKSVIFIDKAIQLSPRHALAYRMKGEFLLSRQRAEQAVIAFFQATSIDKDVHTLAGLVQAHLALKKPADALAAAKDAIDTHPRSSTALFLYATVMASSKDGQKEAIKLFKKILQMYPTHKGAVSSIAVLLSSQGKHEEAIAFISACLERKSCPKLLTRLGKLLMRVGRNYEALGIVNTALCTSSSSSADHTEAIQELERLERLIKGDDVGDPDEEIPSSRHLAVV